MTNTAYFDPAVGGNGLTVTDDGNPTTGLDNDGHRERLVPALAQVVAVAGNTVTKATEAATSALTASNAASSAAASALSASNSATASETAKNAAIVAKDAAEDAAETAEFWAGEAGSIATGAVKISGTDTTAGSLSTKLVVTDGLTATILNAGGNEQLQIKADGLQQEIAASSGLSYFLQGVI